MDGKLFAFNPEDRRREGRRWVRPSDWLAHFLALLLALLAAIWFGILFERFTPDGALRHLIAIGGCDAARFAEVAPAMRGGAGYWWFHDPNRDGISCDG